METCYLKGYGGTPLVYLVCVGVGVVCGRGTGRQGTHKARILGLNSAMCHPSQNSRVAAGGESSLDELI